MSDVFMGVAALLTAVGSLIASLVSARKAWKAVDELSPNHGGSVKDAVNRTERNIQRIEDSVGRLGDNVQHLDNEVKSIGHQIGEIRRDNVVHMEGMQASLKSLDGRVSNLEARLE